MTPFRFSVSAAVRGLLWELFGGVLIALSFAALTILIILSGGK